MNFTKRTYKTLRDRKVSEALGCSYSGNAEKFFETLDFLDRLGARAIREGIWNRG